MNSKTDVYSLNSTMTAIEYGSKADEEDYEELKYALSDLDSEMEDLVKEESGLDSSDEREDVVVATHLKLAFKRQFVREAIDAYNRIVQKKR